MHGLVCEVRAVSAQDLGVCWTSETYWGQQDFGSQSEIQKWLPDLWQGGFNNNEGMGGKEATIVIW